MSKSLQELLTEKLHTPHLQITPVGGGSINQTFKVSTTTGVYFCKVNSATKFPHLFQKEAKGLQLLGRHGILKVPGVKENFCAGDQQVLLLEWIDSGSRTDDFWKTFGAQLAALHHISQATFGLDHDNYMGSVEQVNTASIDWTTFFIHHRLQPLVEQCRNRHFLSSKHQQLFDRLYQRLPDLFAPQSPSLLHGDLWSGNFICDAHSQPVLIDPAVYFGHRSMDLGMTTLFGGFDRAFYQSYHYHYPLPPNYSEQWRVCNLYPLLIHLLLFGNSYLSQIESTLRQFT